jgi:TetR/AcrR family transcriptional regulator, transcriptional repressor for nem operon
MNAKLEQKQQKQDTRQRILASAGKAIREQGLQAPSVSSVMGAAGLTVGGFYAHFESKEALLLEALDEMLGTRMNQWFASLKAMPANERRQYAARGYLSRKHRDIAGDRCPMPMVLAELDHVDPRFKTLIADYLERWAAALGADDEPDSRSKALAAMVTMIGALTVARGLGASAFSDEILAAAKAAIR